MNTSCSYHYDNANIGVRKWDRPEFHQEMQWSSSNTREQFNVNQQPNTQDADKYFQYLNETSDDFEILIMRHYHETSGLFAKSSNEEFIEIGK